jgi:predicted Rossmann-fold nucleotide-binding protein
VAGFYDRLLAFMDQTVEQGFLDADQRAVPLVDTDPARLLERILAAAAKATAPDDYSRI